MYTEKLLNRFTSPKNIGQVKGANAVAKVGDAVRGDIIKVSIKIEDETVFDAKVKVFGCAAAIACADVAMELIKGKTIDEALQVSSKDVLNIIGELPSDKKHCSVLAQEAIEEAIKDYRKRQLKKRV